MAEEQIQAEVKPETWALVELMGHRERAGRVSEVEIASAKFLRIDVPSDDGEYITEYYAAGAIYSIRPGTEEIIRARGRPVKLPARPVDFTPVPQIPAPAETVVTDGESDRRDDEYGDESDEYGER